MIYCRFAPDHSDVYVYADTRGYIRCCMCAIEVDWNTTITDEPTMAREMIAHLDKHRAVGHKVPEYAFDRLREEAYPSSTQFSHEEKP